MRCQICKWTSKDVNSLILHVRTLHGSQLKNLVCGEDDCLLTFTNIPSYRKHLRMKHFEPCKSPALPNESDNCSKTRNKFDKAAHNVDTCKTDFKTLMSTSANIARYTNDTANASAKPNYDQLIEQKIATFVSSLNRDPQLTRKIVQDFIDKSTQVFQDILSTLKDQLTMDCSNCISDVQQQHQMAVNIETRFKESMNVYSQFDTEYKRFKYFEEKGFFIRPDDYTIKDTSINKLILGTVNEVPAQICGQSISLKKSLKALLHLPGYLDKIKNYMNDLKDDKSGIISNFIQGSYWKTKKKSYGCKTVFPLMIYFDDYETGNVLGSHSGDNKLGAVYASLLCAPPELRSKLVNIIVCSLFYSIHRKMHGNEAVFINLINELNDLQTSGIDVTIDNKKETVFFDFSLLVGDNLGLHGITGLVESFSANKCCRICTLSKAEFNKTFAEKSEYLRTRESYENDLVKSKDMEDAVKETGIKEKCLWHLVSGFHITEGVGVDLMHDFCEGVANSDLTLILEHYIRKGKFSLDVLNSRIETFFCGRLEISNKPPFIRNEHLKSHLRMSASEILCFTRYFGLIIGDLVDENCEIWKLYTLLREILSIIAAETLHAGIEHYLNAIVTEHHELYKKLFNKSITFKYHMLTHYGSLIVRFGPLKHIWTMRFEAKHREGKLYANVCASRVNIIHSIAMKHQLIFCDYLVNYSYGDNCEFRILGPIQRRSAVTYEFRLPSDLRSNIRSVSAVQWQGIQYRTNVAVVVKLFENDLPTFGIICDILIQNNDVFLVLHPAYCIGFSNHYFAYEIRIEKSKEKTLTIKFKNLPTAVGCLYFKRGGDHYVSTKHYI